MSKITLGKYFVNVIHSVSMQGLYSTILGFHVSNLGVTVGWQKWRVSTYLVASSIYQRELWNFFDNPSSSSSCQISFIALTSLFLLLPGKFVASRHVQGHVGFLAVIGALRASELLLLAVKITRWFIRLETRIVRYTATTDSDFKSDCCCYRSHLTRPEINVCRT